MERIGRSRTVICRCSSATAEPEGALPPFVLPSAGADAPEDDGRLSDAKADEVELDETDLDEEHALVDRYDAAVLPHDVEAHEREATIGLADGKALISALGEVMAAKRRDHAAPT